MSPKVRKGMIPKPILAMKDKLGENCTTESIMEVDPKLRKSALSSFDRYISRNHSEQYGEYQKIQEFEKKREWMSSFITDGDEGLSRMINTFSRQVTQRTSPASNPIPIRPKVLSRIACSDSGLLWKITLRRRHHFPWRPRQRSTSMRWMKPFKQIQTG